jgi:hypothetical protein
MRLGEKSARTKKR